MLVSEIPFKTSAPNVPPVPGNYGGSYIGISALQGIVWPCWYDNRTGVNQVYTSRIEFALEEPTLVLSARSLSFLSEVGGVVDTLCVSMTNYGLDTLVVSSISSPASGFDVISVSELPIRLATAQSSQLHFTFTPLSEGSVTDSIIIVSNDPANPAVRILLKGEGVVIGRAQPGVMYATSIASPEGQLYEMNALTGELTPVGSLGNPGIQAVAVRPSNSELYGTSTSLNGTTLYRISTNSGTAVPLSTTSVANFRAIAFGPGDTLYGATESGTLHRIDHTTGQAVLIGRAQGLSYSGLSFSPNSGTLWASVLTPTDSIYTLNTTTGAATPVGATGFQSLTSSLAFDAQGVLYALIDNGSGENYLATLDTNTAVGTLVAGPLSVSNLTAIAMNAWPATYVGDGADDTAPGVFSLSQNYPNPFNPATVIQYTVAAPSGLPAGGVAGVEGQSVDSRVRISVFVLLGREVAVLVDEEKPPGTYTVAWNASNMPSGVCFFKLTSGTFTQTRTMALMK